jgi:hypothetical protein
MQLGLQRRFELWLPLTFRPPILMWPLYPYQATVINQEAETKRFEVKKSFKGFYYKLGTTPKSHTAPTDFRETTRKLNDGGPSLG